MKKAILALFTMTLGLTFVISDFQPAYAKESASEEFTLQEIVVTAQKREQQVQNVPIAITVTTPEQMERQMVYTLQDLSRTTPGLEFGDTGNGPGGAAVIRGIGTQVFGGQMEPSVGVVVDGVPQGGINIGNMFDVERVEVLRGPQGTLFGNSASAGVINIITAAPDTKGFKGRVGVDATLDGKLGSKYGRQEVRTMLNVPFNEKSAVRVTGNGNFMQGIRKNLYPGMDDYDSKNYDFRARYLLKATDDLSINVTADYAQRRSSGPYLFTLTYLKSTAGTDPSINYPLLYAYFTGHGITPSLQNQDVYTDAKMGQQQKRYGLSAQIQWTMLNHDFISITSFKENKSGPGGENIFGYGHPKLNAALVPPLSYYYFLDIRRIIGTGHTKTYTEEFRVSAPAHQKLDYLGGLYYNMVKSYTDTLGSSQSWLPAAMPPALQGVFTPGSTIGSGTNTNMAVFGDANYPLTDALKVLGGMRLSRYKINSLSRNINPASTSFGWRTEANLKKSYFSWRAGGQYDINKDIMTYLTISRGVKAPVVVAGAMTDPSAQDTPDTIINAEIPTSYEAGTKVTAFNNKVALDFNIFFNNIKDYQGQTCVYNPTTNALGCTAATIPKIVSKGLEVDIFGRPIPGVQINIGYVYNIAEYPAAYSAALEGKQIANALRHKFVFSGEYGRPMTEALYGFFAMDATFKSNKRLTNMLLNSSVYPACWMFGSKIGIREMSDKWSLTLFGRNLFREPEPVAIYQAFNDDNVIMSITSENSFRQVGISLNMTF